MAIDQGTSSTKTVIFDENGVLVAKGSEALNSHHPQPGFVEQDPEEIYQNVLASVKIGLDKFSKIKPGEITKIAGIGISNQRETFLLWDSQGNPISNAIVWQCKRSVDICSQLKQQAGLEQQIRERTGLIIDPYFSGTKLLWLFEKDEEVRQAIQSGKAHFGTIDTWLLFRLTNGSTFATDYTNASRTLLFNLQELNWDQYLLQQFGLQNLILPEIHPSSWSFGTTNLNSLLPNPIPVSAMIGDSHAAAFGEGCFSSGTAKATLGTGCSILWNTGSKPIRSQKGMLTTICWSTAERIDYALEGAIVSCGATIEWLKQQLGLFSDSKETEAIAQSIPDNGGVYLVPAFSGLGAPHWQMDRKAAIKGMTFSSDKRHIIRASLESIPFQIKDVIACMESESGVSLQTLNIDGGITTNQFVVQMLADLLGTQVCNIGITDVSALGASYLAGLETGVFQDLEHIASLAHATRTYHPGDSNTVSLVNENYKGWKNAIEAS